MSKLFKNKPFKYGFILGIVLSLIIQLFTYVDYLVSRERLIHLSGINIDVIWYWGLPFPIFYGGDFILRGLIGNILVAIIFSFIIGLIFKFVWSKISVRRLR